MENPDECPESFNPPEPVSARQHMVQLSEAELMCCCKALLALTQVNMCKSAQSRTHGDMLESSATMQTALFAGKLYDRLVEPVLTMPL